MDTAIQLCTSVCVCVCVCVCRMQRPPVIKTKEMVKEKIALLEVRCAGYQQQLYYTGVGIC